MLRRRLLLILALLTGLMMALALAAIWAMQDVFAELEHLSSEAGVVVEESQALNEALATVEVELHSLQAGRKRHLDTLIETVQAMHELTRRVGDRYVVRQPAVQEIYHEMQRQLSQFEQSVAALATAQHEELALRHNLSALASAAGLRQQLLQISRHIHSHLQDEQAALTYRFRWLAIGLGLGFLLVINASVLLLLKAAGMVVRPVEQLVQASRELGRENFGHRVQLQNQGEFSELAQAFNHLGQQLEQNEHRKIETLQQVALTLNHELNNAMAIIQLQLSLLRRHSGDSGSEKCLRQIRENLQRMAEVVQSLRHVRRIVLTEYEGGEKMLDLKRSLESDLASEEPSSSKDSLPFRT